MQEFNNGIQPDRNERLPSIRAAYLPATPAAEVAAEGGEGTPINLPRILRKYILLMICLAILGGAVGFVSVALTPPIYGGRALLEVQATTAGSFIKSSGPDNGDINVNIQTQTSILQSSSFLTRVAERLQLETIPPAPLQSDIFGRLRARLRTTTQDPLEAMKQGVGRALGSFRARPITGTRVIEISCDSTNPEIASNFVNTAASEFSEQNSQARIQAAQQASQWLSGQLEETRTKLQDAQQRLQDFGRSSGNLFVLQDSTLAVSKLRELQSQLSAIQADRIVKQSRYELIKKTPPDQLADVLDDGRISSYQSRLADLRREAAALLTTLTPANPKVKKVQAQISEIESTLNKEVAAAAERIKNDYDSALRREKLLSNSYHGQAEQVSSEASQATVYNGLRRDVESLQQMYNAMLLQANETNAATSIPANTIRNFDPASPAPAPYKPVPAVNIGLGIVTGMLLSGAIAFLSEKLDNSVRQPGHSRRLLNVPELGVIPSVEAGPARAGWRRFARLSSNGNRPAEVEPASVLSFPRTGTEAWQGAPEVAESFRVTLASLMRENGTGNRPQTILVTSPRPAEGKTTIASNLGVALAETGRRVLLVDADCRRPFLHKMFGVPNTWGLTNILAGESEISDQIGIATRFPGLLLVPNGPPPESVSRILYSPRLGKFFQWARGNVDLILIDAPPILEVADARVISEFADGAVLVLRSGNTARADALEAYQQLYEDGTVLLGTVLNDWRRPGRERQYYSYYMATRES